MRRFEESEPAVPFTGRPDVVPYRPLPGAPRLASVHAYRAALAQAARVRLNRLDSLGERGRELLARLERGLGTAPAGTALRRIMRRRSTLTDQLHWVQREIDRVEAWWTAAIRARLDACERDRTAAGRDATPAGPKRERPGQ